MVRDLYGNALTAAQIDALYALRRKLDEPNAAAVRAKHDAARTRNARLRAHNLRRSLVARGVIRTTN